MSSPLSAFGPKAMKKHWGLIPTVAICGGACVMCASYVTYMATTKTDLSWRPWSYKTTPPYTDVAPTEVHKFLNMHTITRNPEAEALKREIADAYRQ